jgi:small subunit ribosomal protein S6
LAAKAGRNTLNDYELVTILNPEIRDEDVNGTVERITQYITSKGGEVQNIDQWGRRRLAYPIARQFEGTYIVTHLRLAPADAAELEANLRISEDVLRHLLVRYSPAEQAAAIAASQRRRPRLAPDEAPTGAMGTAEGSETAEPEAATGAVNEAVAPPEAAVEQPEGAGEAQVEPSLAEPEEGETTQA